jgi:glycosyltransferase involved in cell wall biosynthesis
MTDNSAIHIPCKQIVFSICIPTYNRADFIKEAIQSALNQTFDKYEVVVVDDGSTDGTKEIVQSFNSPKIRYIFKEHAGAPQTRNRAVREARGEFILWLDSDDILQNSILQEYQQCLQQYDDFDVLYCDNVRYYSDEDREEVIRYRSFLGTIPPVKFFGGPPIPNVGSLIRRSLFDKVGYYNPDFKRAHDYEFWVRAIKTARFRHCPKLLYRHVLHGKGQLSPVDYKDTDVSYEVKITQNIISNYTLEELYPDVAWSVLSQDEKDKILSSIYIIYMKIFVKWRDFYQARHYLEKSIELDPSSEKSAILQQFNDLLLGNGTHQPQNQPTSPSANIVSCRSHPINQFRVIALVSAHNEGDVIYHVIGDLIQQNVEVYLINHCSTDNTVKEASKWLGKGLIHIENFPQDALYPEENSQAFIWTHILKRKEELAASLNGTWFIHHDADEFRESPWPHLSLLEAIHVVDKSGYSAIDFELLNFRPTDNSFIPGNDVREALRYYELSESFNRLQIKAWKKQKHPVSLAMSGGHDVQFEGKNICPVKFVLRHYPIRSQEHGMKKIFQERKSRFNRQEQSWGWHVQYNNITHQNHNFLYDPSNLTLYDGNKVRLSILSAQAYALNQQIRKERCSHFDSSTGLFIP